MNFTNLRCMIHTQKEKTFFANFKTETGLKKDDAIQVSYTEDKFSANKGANKSLLKIGKIQINIKNETSRECDNLRMYKPVQIHLAVDEKPEKMTALYMFSEWWSRPYFTNTFTEIPDRTQVLLLKFKDHFACIVPAIGQVFKSYLTKGTDTELCFEMTAGMGGQSAVHEPLYVMAEDANILNAVHAAFTWLADYRGIKTRDERRLPEMFKYLGWCSWDAFYKEVDAEKFVAKSKELKEKLVPAKWMLLDDGWMQDDADRLCSFVPDQTKFPDGFQSMLGTITDNTDVKWFGLWHALTGYWAGVCPDSELAKSQASYLMKTVSGKLIPDPEKAANFYENWYNYLSHEGFDFVKVDSQSSSSYYIENTLPVGSTTKKIHESLEAGAQYMDSAIINCMGMAMENVLSRPNSAINRNSDDFFPSIEGSFYEHLLQNAYNAIYQDEIYYCDWDMFWTNHGAARKHALLRAICGGPVYFSDRLDETNPEILKPLVYSDGKILMMDHSAKPTEDCIFEDPFKDHVLKLQNTADWGKSEKAGGIAVYNFTDTVLPFTLSSTDIEGLEKADAYWVYDFLKKTVFTLKTGEICEKTLDAYGYGWFVFIPKKTDGSCLGLLDKFVGFTAARTILETENSIIFSVRESGKIGWLSEKKPEKITVNNVAIEPEIQCNGNLFVLNLPEEAQEIIVTIEK